LEVPGRTYDQVAGELTAEAKLADFARRRQAKAHPARGDARRKSRRRQARKDRARQRRRKRR
jgi:hypothetical protein